MHIQSSSSSFYLNSQHSPLLHKPHYALLLSDALFGLAKSPLLVSNTYPHIHAWMTARPYPHTATGIVKKWKTGAGYGFITPHDGGRDIFVHKKVIDVAYLSPGDSVGYELKQWTQVVKGHRRRSRRRWVLPLRSQICRCWVTGIAGVEAQRYWQFYGFEQASAGSACGRVPPIGSQISLVSDAKMRYEGILYNIDTEANTITLKTARCLGTEGRKDPVIPPTSVVFRFITFRSHAVNEICLLDTRNVLADPAVISVNKRPGGESPNVGPTADTGNQLIRLRHRCEALEREQKHVKEILKAMHGL